MKKVVKNKFFRSILIVGLFILGIILLADVYISKSAKKYNYDEVSKIPENRVGLVLGASKKLASGSDNLYYKNRIKAAKELYDSEKIQKIVVSGDNSREDYNEAEDMKDDLVNEGIPVDSIYLDYAGLRTLDSVIRMKEIFGQNKFTIISQKFHNERAILIAKYNDLDVVGYNAQDANLYHGFKTMMREKLARVKVFIDFLMNKKPKYLGEKIEIK